MLSGRTGLGQLARGTTLRITPLRKGEGVIGDIETAPWAALGIQVVGQRTSTYHSTGVWVSVRGRGVCVGMKWMLD